MVYALEPGMGVKTILAGCLLGGVEGGETKLEMKLVALWSASCMGEPLDSSNLLGSGVLPTSEGEASSRPRLAGDGGAGLSAGGGKWAALSDWGKRIGFLVGVDGVLLCPFSFLGLESFKTMALWPNSSFSPSLRGVDVGEGCLRAFCCSAVIGGYWGEELLSPLSWGVGARAQADLSLGAAGMGFGVSDACTSSIWCSPSGWE